MKTKELFRHGEGSVAYEWLVKHEYPWQAVPHIGECILEIGEALPKEKYDRDGDVWVAKSATVAKTAFINGPAIIGEGAEVRHCAYIRGNVIIGDGCVVGNSCEVKNSILLSGVQIPHYNYVGDSVLGYRAHMGAGSVASNVRGDKRTVCVWQNCEKTDTGLRKLGAMVGDLAEIGCGCVLNPGAVIGVGARIYPLCSVRGEIGENEVYRGRGE